MRPIVYCLPGLGTDRRMYAYQHQLDLDLRFLEMIRPDPKDSLASYAQKLMAQIDQSQPFSLMGVSMGGMMSMEISKLCKPEKVCIISSCKTKNELPRQFTIFRRTKIHRILSAGLFKRTIRWYSSFFTDLNPMGKYAFLNMIEAQDPYFLRWAANAIITWDNETIPEKLLHIHGNKDNVLPYSRVKADITVEQGTHFMVSSRADEINQLINDFFLGKN